MLEVSQKQPDKGLSWQLNCTVCAGDAIANNVLYHNLCWATVRKKEEAPRKTVYTNQKVIHAVSKIKLINLIKLELNYLSHQILDINKVNITYRNLLCENGPNINEICESFKKQLKIRI